MRFLVKTCKLCAMDVRVRLSTNLTTIVGDKKQEWLEERSRECDPEGLGLSQQYIGKLISGKADNPTLKALLLLAEVLEVDITDLLADPEAHPEEPNVRVRVLQKRVSELAAQNRELFLNLEGLVRTLVKNIQP